MKTRTRTIAISALVITLVAGIAAPSLAATRLAHRGGAVMRTSLTVVPAGELISSAAPVEVRLAITNPRTTSVTASVAITWTGTPGGTRLSTTSVSIAAGATVLVDKTFNGTTLLGRSRGAVEGRVKTEVTVTGAHARNQWRLKVVPSSTQSLPIATVGWIEPGAYIDGVYPQSRPITAADVRDDMDAMHSVGIDTVVFTYSEYIANGWGAFFDSANPAILPAATSFDVLGNVLSEAATNGQHVYVGLGRGNDGYLTYTGFDDPARVAAGLSWSESLADELWSLYGTSPAFYGWYATLEAADIAGANHFYDPLADYLHAFSPDKPVLIAPSGTPISSSSIVTASHSDVFAYQDAVGAGYIGPDASCLPSCTGPFGTYPAGYAYTFNPGNRIADLSTIFSGYDAWHSGGTKSIWADLEAWQMDGPSYASPHPAAFSRVEEQIDAEAPYVDAISIYAFPGFFAPPSSTLEHGGPAAVSLFEDYRAYYDTWLSSI